MLNCREFLLLSGVAFPQRGACPTPAEIQAHQYPAHRRGVDVKAVLLAKGLGQQFRTPARPEVAKGPRRVLQQCLQCPKQLLIDRAHRTSPATATQPFNAAGLEPRYPAIHRRACRHQRIGHRRHTLPPHQPRYRQGSSHQTPVFASLCQRSQFPLLRKAVSYYNRHARTSSAFFSKPVWLPLTDRRRASEFLTDLRFGGFRLVYEGRPTKRSRRYSQAI